MKKRALITGINGMAGSHLADFLLQKDYEVHGLERRTSQKIRINTGHLEEKINLHLKKIFPEFKKLNIDKMIKKEMQRKIYALENLISATKQIENLKKERSEYENNSIRTTRHRKNYNFIK